MSAKNLVFLALLLSQPCHAAGRRKFSNEPTGVITFDKTLEDFGTVKRGQKLTARFKFTNTGGGPLIIQGIQAPCDCTTMSTAKGKTILPNASDTVDIVFDTTDYMGNVTKAVTVITNERALADRTLTISALVNSDVEASPPLIDFGDVFVNQTPKAEVRIKNTMKTELKIESLRYNETALEVTQTKAGKDWIISVKLKPTVPIGFFKDTIYVKNNSPSLPEMPIPVRASVKGLIATNPAYIEFGAVASNDKSNRQVNLTGVDNFEITNHRVELLINGIKTDATSKFIKINVQSNDVKGKKIALELANPGSIPGSVHGKVYMDTTMPLQKTLTIDFYAFFR